MASAIRTYSFLQSIGVNTHVIYYDTPYANNSVVVSDLIYLDVNHVRDNLPPSDPGFWTGYRPLMASGVKFDLVVPTGQLDIQSNIMTVDSLLSANPGGIDAIEGLNEIDSQPSFSYAGLIGLPAAVAYQQALFTAVESDPELAQVAVYNLTLLEWGPYRSLPNMSGMATAGNAHIYTGYLSPSSNLSGRISVDSATTPGLPMVLTETGFDTITQYDTTNAAFVNQDVQAKYTLDDYLDAYQLGFVTTYVYELLDEQADPGNTNHEYHWGLFNSDGTPKEAAVALHNLTSVLSDTGSNAANFQTTSMNFTISGLPKSGNSMLFQKSNGMFDIVIWNEPLLWNSSNNTQVGVAPTNIVVNLGAMYQSVSLYDPLSGTTSLASYSNVSQIAVSIIDHPIIIETSAAAPVVTPGARVDTLDVHVSEDAWQGDAQFTIAIDGVTIGGLRTATASHGAGATQDVTLTGTWGAGPHTVGVAFLNDAWGGTSAADRNLYVDAVSYDSVAIPGMPHELYSSGTKDFYVAGTTPPLSTTLTLHLSEDAWQGDAQYSVAVDGVQVGGVGTETVLHSSGASDPIALSQALSVGTHDVAVSFLNDAWGGSNSTDRNLYMNGIDVNGTAQARLPYELYTTSTAHLAVVVPGR